jgi:hypothetical protein
MTACILQFPPFVVRLAAEVRSAAPDFCNFPGSNRNERIPR